MERGRQVVDRVAVGETRVGLERIFQTFLPQFFVKNLVPGPPGNLDNLSISVLGDCP